jgi:hypothetical protein
LIIGARIATYYRAFVPIDIEPTQPFKHSFNRPRNQPCLVGIFNSYDKFAAMMTRKQPIEEGCADVSDMR